MQLARVKIRNFMGLTSLEIDPMGKFNLVKGDNGKGKTSVLNAVTGSFQPSLLPKVRVIKNDADDSTVLIDITEAAKEIRLKRRFTNSGRPVEIKEDGIPINESPQAYLDALFGPNQLDPSRFFLADKKARLELVMKALPITLSAETLAHHCNTSDFDFTKFSYEGHGLKVLSRVQAEVYEDRKELGAQKGQLESAMREAKKAIPKDFDAEKYEGFDIDEKMGEIEKAQQVIAAHESRMQQFQLINAEIVGCNEEIAELDKKLKNTKAALNKCALLRSTVNKQIEDYKAPDTDAIKAEVTEYQEAQGTMNKLTSIGEQSVRLKKVESQHEVLDDLYRQLKVSVPKKLLESAELPVKGLEIDDGELKVDGIALDGRSKKEQLEFACNMAKSMAGKAKLIVLDDFEHFSPGNRQLFREINKDDGFQYLMAVADDGDLEVVVD